MRKTAPNSGRSFICGWVREVREIREIRGFFEGERNDKAAEIDNFYLSIL